jgi:hypothetical protein
MPDTPAPLLSISPLYARYLTRTEKTSLRRVPLDDISSEINLLRKLTALFMKLQQTAPRDLVSCIQALRTCTLLCEQLAILVRFHDRDHGPRSEWHDILDEALAQIPVFLDDRRD